MNDSIPDSKEEWEDLKESVDEKDLLLRQTFALEQILLELQQRDRTQEETQEYQCDVCGGVFAKHELERHSKDCFGWMPEMGNVTKHYREL